MLAMAYVVWARTSASSHTETLSQNGAKIPLKQGSTPLKAIYWRQFSTASTYRPENTTPPGTSPSNSSVTVTSS